jgi:1,4-alpha-glucan branching enzyme
MAVIALNAFDALAGARHPDPFSVLGPHVDEGTLVIRTLQPTAERVDVVRMGGAATPMSRAHQGGVFEAVFDRTSEVFDYRLRALRIPTGTRSIDDPFG